MTASTGRLGFLSKLLGSDKAADLIADTHDAAELLDGAGVERKEMKPGEEKPEEEMPMHEGEEQPPAEDAPAEEPPEDEEKQDGDLVTDVGAKLAQVIIDAESQNGGKPLTQEQYAAVIADALRPAVEAEAEPEAEPEAPPAETAPTEQPQQEDTGKAVGEILKISPNTYLYKDREDSPPAPEADAQEAVKAMSDLLGQMVHDQGEMAKAYQPLVEQVAALQAQLTAVQTELTEAKALKPIAEELARTVEELKARLADRPRQASQSPETVLDPQNDQVKAIAEAAAKGLRGSKKVLGVTVRE